MVDRNNNGIDDSREGRKQKNKYRPGQTVAQPDALVGKSVQRAGVNPFFFAMEQTPVGPAINGARQFLNFFRDAGDPTSSTEDRIGTGFGDQIFGVQPGYYDQFGGKLKRTMRSPARTEAPQQESSLPSFLENLMTALGYTDSGSSMDYVNYDPLRGDARNRGTEYDARLNAMYNQLQGSIRDDGTALQGSYQGAIDDNAARAVAAQEQTQGAGDAAQARNLQQLQALGIGDAASNIVAQGRDLNTQVASAVQDAAARGQISGDALAQNQQSAVQHNTNLVGAAGLEGNLQRARVQSELANLLAQYDMQEQQANQEVDQFNASQRGSGLGQAMSLASALTDDQWTQQNYADELSQAQYSANQPNTLSQSMSFLQQLMGSPQFAGQSIEEILPYIQALGSVGKLM